MTEQTALLEEYVAAFVPEAEYLTWEEALLIADARSNDETLDMTAALEAANVA